MRGVILSAALFVLVSSSARHAAQQPAPSGAAVYKQRCAGCHEGTLPRMPTRQALGAMSPEHIESELASFSMRRQGAALSPAERRAVAEFLDRPPAGVVPSTDRHHPEERVLHGRDDSRRSAQWRVVERVGNRLAEHAASDRPRLRD